MASHPGRQCTLINEVVETWRDVSTASSQDPIQAGQGICTARVTLWVEYFLVPETLGAL